MLSVKSIESFLAVMIQLIGFCAITSVTLTHLSNFMLLQIIRRYSCNID